MKLWQTEKRHLSVEEIADKLQDIADELHEIELKGRIMDSSIYNIESECSEVEGEVEDARSQLIDLVIDLNVYLGREKPLYNTSSSAAEEIKVEVTEIKEEKNK
tara:strand:+ start:613 stop:924 length:312 start_codon:yes stop_codon:yes gene_type:complete